MTIQVVAAFLVRDGRFLLSCRSSGPYSGKWEFPGGKIEPGETEEEAIIREIKEELGMDISTGKKMGVFTHDYPERTIEMTLIECVPENEEWQISSDGSHTDFRFVNEEEATSLDVLPLDLKILDFLKKNIS